MEFKHYSVLLHETIRNLNLKENGLYVDATFGGGGHAQYLLNHLDKGTLDSTDAPNKVIDIKSILKG